MDFKRQLGSSSDEWDEGDDFWNDSDSNYQQPSTRRGRKKKSQSQKKARKNSSSRGRTQERGGKNSSSSRGNSRGCGRGRGGGNTGGRRKRGPAKPVSEETKQAVERRKEELEEKVSALSEAELRALMSLTIQSNPSPVFDLLTQHTFRPGTPHNPNPPPGQNTPDWCTCHRCCEMPTDAEKLCCGQMPDNCISQLADFQILVLEEEVLRIARDYRREILAFPDQLDQNKNNRHAAYRQFVLWQYGRLGAGNRRVIPSCCVWRIRDKFPDRSGQYTGYIPCRLG